MLDWVLSPKSKPPRFLEHVFIGQMSVLSLNQITGGKLKQALTLNVEWFQPFILFTGDSACTNKWQRKNDMSDHKQQNQTLIL